MTKTNGGPYRRDNGILLREAALYKAELVERVFGAGLPVAVAAEVGDPPPTANLLSAVPFGSNVQGIGYGVKTTAGAAIEGTLAIRVYVRTKLTQADLGHEAIPPAINGVPTDVVEVGDILTASTARTRPAPGGVSVGHKSVSAGTLGCWVQKTDNSAPRYILSNNHVLANTNAGLLDDDILQPGRADGGSLPTDLIARLTDFEPIVLVAPGSPLMPTPNIIDAAIAEVIDSVDANPTILSIGSVINPPLPAAIYQSVRKHGRTTLHTVGVITDISASIRVRYGTQFADFDDQLAIIGAGGAFAAGGDSGSLIVDATTLNPVGLLFAVGNLGATSTTFANPIDIVLARFNIQIV